MSLRKMLKNLISKNSKGLVYEAIKPNRVKNAKPALAAKSDEHYFRVMLSQMFLTKDVKWFQAWYPAVHSLVECSFAGDVVAIPNVADSSRLLTQQDGKGHVIARNFTLVPLMPFKGGEVRMVVGLFAVQGQNTLNNFIGVMSDFAKLLAVPQLSSALSVAAPLSKGIQTLFGGTGGMHLGFHDTFVGAGGHNELTNGYMALIHATERKVDPKSLFVVEDELRVGTGLKDGEHAPFQQNDFMLIHVEVRPDRDDFNQLPSIAKSFGQAIEAIGDLDDEKAETHFRQALVAAMRAPELTKADKRRVVELLKADFQEAKAGLSFSNLVGDEGFDLQKRMNESAISIDKALALGEPTFADIM